MVLQLRRGPQFVSRGGLSRAQVEAEITESALSGLPFLSVGSADLPASVRARCTHKADGTGGDEATINQALADWAANDTRFAGVYLSPGVFSVGGSILVEHDSTALWGAGAGQRDGATQDGVGTRIIAGSAFNDPIVQVQRAANDRPVYGVTLRDFTVDGATLGVGQVGILWRSNRGEVERVHVHRTSGHGIRCLGYVGTWDLYDSSLVRVIVGDAGADSMLMDEASTDMHLVSCILFAPVGDNLRIKAGSLQITACHFYDAGRSNVYFDGAGSRTKLMLCKIEGANQHGVVMDATVIGQSDVQIIGNGFANNGDGLDDTYDHLILTRASGTETITRTQITNNNFSWKGNGNKPRYGVNLSSSVAQQNLLAGNAFGPASHFGTAPVNIAFSATGILAPNQGAATQANGTASVVDGGTIAHGLAKAPSRWQVNPTVAGRIANVTATSGTTLTVGLKQHDGAAVAVAENVDWSAEV